MTMLVLYDSVSVCGGDTQVQHQFELNYRFSILEHRARAACLLSTKDDIWIAHDDLVDLIRL